MSATEAEERAQFTLAMRARGINDLGLLRALERAPRALFMPPRFADIAGRDIALPIGCGQTSPPPSIVAAMIAALDLKPAHRVCEIGTGTGYCAALLAQLANAVVSLERFQTLAVEASARIKAFGLANVAVHWADGFELHALGRALRPGPCPWPHRAAGRGVSPPDPPGRGSGCGRRRPGSRRAAHRQTDATAPARRGRGRGHGSGARDEAARAWARARSCSRKRAHSTRGISTIISQPTIHLKPSLNSIGANCICLQLRGRGWKPMSDCVAGTNGRAFPRLALAGLGSAFAVGMFVRRHALLPKRQSVLQSVRQQYDRAAPTPGVTTSPLAQAAPAASATHTASLSRPQAVGGSAAGWTAAGGSPIVVANGETLDTLSGRYGVPAAAILSANGLSSASEVKGGMHIVVPVYHADGHAVASAETRRRRESDDKDVADAEPAKSAKKAKDKEKEKDKTKADKADKEAEKSASKDA